MGDVYVEVVLAVLRGRHGMGVLKKRWGTRWVLFWWCWGSRGLDRGYVDIRRGMRG